MRALVAGATGFIGTVLTERLLSDGADVRALVRSARRTRGLPAEKIDLHEGDVLEPETLAGAGVLAIMSIRIGPSLGRMSASVVTSRPATRIVT